MRNLNDTTDTNINSKYIKIFFNNIYTNKTFKLKNITTLQDYVDWNTSANDIFGEDIPKKENGDKLGLPSLSIVLAKAIGLGAIAPKR